MNLLETSLAEISQEVPGATAIFNHYNLSFCCGGKKSLKEAIAGADLDQNEVLAPLLKLMEQSDLEVNWDEASDQELISFISETAKNLYSTQLPELFRLADRVETVHGNKQECPVGLANVIKDLIAHFDEHIGKENHVLFPRLLEGKANKAAMAIDSLRESHEVLIASLAKIDKLTNNIITPEGVCNTWNALFLGLRAFKADLLHFNHLENDILFGRYADVHGETFCCGSCGGS